LSSSYKYVSIEEHIISSITLSGDGATLAVCSVGADGPLQEMDAEPLTRPATQTGVAYVQICHHAQYHDKADGEGEEAEEDITNSWIPLEPMNFEYVALIIIVLL
jgi:hypothetical protein